jgi:hypothetical protein
MGRGEAIIKDWSIMTTIDVDTAEDGGETSWNHVKTFALVGVSSNDFILTVEID